MDASGCESLESMLSGRILHLCIQMCRVKVLFVTHIVGRLMRQRIVKQTSYFRRCGLRVSSQAARNSTPPPSPSESLPNPVCKPAAVHWTLGRQVWGVESGIPRDLWGCPWQGGLKIWSGGFEVCGIGGASRPKASDWPRLS